MKISSLLKFLSFFTLTTTNSQVANAQKANEGVVSPDTTQIMQLCVNGVEYYKRGEFKTAQLTYNEAINKAKALSSSKERFLALCYELYGDNYFDWRVWGPESTLNYADAKTYYTEAARNWIAFNGENCPEVIRIYNKIGACWLLLENNENAAKWFKNALTTHKSAIVGNPKHLALTYISLFSIYLNIVDYFYKARDYTNTKFYLDELLCLEELVNGDSTDIYAKLLHQLDLLEKERK